MLPSNRNVVVVGLGYVGLPLAVALARNFNVTGFDVDAQRIAELRSQHDRTGEIESARLAEAGLTITDDLHAVPPSEFYIVTVPTPIDEANKPDLTIIRKASYSVGEMLKPACAAGLKPVIIYESTVYPGVTEDLCGPILTEASAYTRGKDFFVGYSPERINPGDREHTVDKIAKVVSAQDQETLDRVAELYGKVTSGQIHRAPSIKVAEAAKVIENAQRDINIAFMNEIAQIFGNMGISVWDVLDAANTKWNFLPFAPGLVGGHCIGVDPYYLSHRAEELGHDPRVILAGRTTNDGMAEWVAGRLHSQRGGKTGTVLVLGLTFKENVPDLRNSKVADLIQGLAARGHKVTVHDPHADAAEAQHEYGLALDAGALSATYDIVLLAVPHREYVAMGASRLRQMVANGGLLADLKGVIGKEADWTL